MPEGELRLLSLDGGGVRGLSALMILDELMEKVNPDSPPKPCDYFDMIGGTSTGGLIAIMLGRLRMSIDECIEAYLSLSDRIFQKKRHRVTIKGKIQGRFDSEELAQAVREVITGKGFQEDALLKDESDNACKVFVCATSKETSETVCLTSYKSPRGGNDLLNSVKIWEACRATSAASSFFDPIAIGRYKEEFVDGGAGANNPIWEVWNQAQTMWGPGPVDGMVRCLVSIGTGVPSLKPFRDDVFHIGETLVAIVTETEQTAERFQQHKAHLDETGRYYRFNVVRGLEEIGLEKSEKKKEIAAATHRYVASQEVFKQMRACANNLARRASVGPLFGLTINSTATRQLEYVGQFSHSSLEPVKAYVPRPLLRNKIRSQLCDDTANTSTKILVVWGLGGAGKSQLVLDYVRQYRANYKTTFWIEAGRKESVERDFVNLYHTLFGIQSGSVNETISVENAVIAVKSWFSGQREPRLMVFDGADMIENEQSSEYIDIKHFIPDVAYLHVIITSRSRTAKDMSQLADVQVGKMEKQQAVELFYRYSQLQRDNQAVTDEITAIVEKLGYLALAITLASTYVGRTHCDIKAYLPEYRQRRRELLNRKPVSLIHQYKESVLTTWETSYRAVAEQNLGASVFMTTLSFLNFDDIYLQLFRFDSQPRNTTSVSSGAADLSPFIMDTGKIEEWFEILESYSLVQWKEDQKSYAMHKLVHAWGYDRLTEDDQIKFCRATSELVVEAIKRCGKSPEEKLRVVPHVMANFTTITSTGKASNWREDTLNRLGMVGMFLTDIGRLDDEVKIEQFVFDTRMSIFGGQHPDTISAMNNLANTLGHQGKLDEAAAMLQEVLEKSWLILGKEHPSTISAINNLAVTLDYQGKLDEAAAMLQEVLDKRWRILGEEHPDTLSAMSNVAAMLGDQGKPDEAAVMMKEVLEKRQRILGEEHPSTISAINNLSNTLGHQGKLDEAVAMKKEVLEKRQRILGEEHPDTISAINNLAAMLRHQGKLDEAAAMLQEVLDKRWRILGEEHPDTLSAMSNVAAMLGDQGKPDEAAAMLQEVLEKRWRILGKEHPDTLSAMNNLAATLRHQGKLDKAAAMLQEVLEKRRLILGEEHPETLLAMNNLAATLGDQGKLDEAVAMKKEVLEKRRRILGEEHLGTLMAMNNLASTLRDLGEIGEAIALLEAAIQRMRRILGDEHPYTQIAIRNLIRITSRSSTDKTKEMDSKEDKDKGGSLYSRIKKRFRRKDA